MTNSGSTLSPSHAGITADYSYGGPEWDRKLRLGVEGLEKAYPLSYETKAQWRDLQKRLLLLMVSRLGFEPRTLALKVRQVPIY